MSLAQSYPFCYRILQDLFSVERINLQDARLNEIYAHTEAMWQNYVHMIPGQTGVRYLLLAEAPPWSLVGDPQYVLNANTPPTTLMNAICRAFFGELICQDISVNATLQLLAEKGFLIIDTLPFAMNYSTHRNNLSYARLVAESCNSYLQKKIDSPDLVWSNEVQIAFAFRINGRTVTHALNDNITLGNRNYRLDGTMIAANAAGYTDGNMLRDIFLL